MSPRRRQLPRGGGRLRGARRRQAPGDGRGAVHLAAARRRAAARALDASRGEPAFVFELDGRTLAFVVEGLGTKSMIARAVLEQQGINRFAEVAYDTVAAIVNDLCCVGALPLVVNAYFATGASEWYRPRERAEALLEGWRQACRDAGCDLGRRGVAVAAGAARRARDRAGRGRRRRAAGGTRAAPGRELRPGDEIVLRGLAAACTPTAPRWRACSPSGCPRATRRLPRTAPASARLCSSRA